MRTVLFTMLMLVACTTPKEAPQTPPKLDTVKPGAPAVVTKTEVTNTSAALVLRFEGAGEHVSVQVSGIEGVTVSSAAEVVSGRSVRAGEELPIAVAFQAAGRGHLVLTVNGTFNGAQRSRVHTVLVGEGPLKDDGAKVQATNDGDTVKLIP